MMDYFLEMSIIIVPALFVLGIMIFAISKPKKNNKKMKALSSLVTLIGMFIVGLLVFIFVISPIFKSSKDGVTGFFENKADHKAHCQTHYTVTEAKTDFAAKQAYEKCMDN
jgi:hypothetical protein